MLFEIFLLLVSALGLVMFLKRDPERLLGIYSQPGKWFPLKKLLFVIFLKVRKYIVKRRSEANGLSSAHTDKNGIKSVGYGVQSHNSIDDMERPQKLSPDESAIDCMYFNGLCAEGSYVIMRIARRNDRCAEIWLSINLPGVGFFQAPVHPDTCVYNTDGETFSAAGLKFECVVPMKRWKVSFNGLLRPKGKSPLVKVIVKKNEPSSMLDQQNMAKMGMHNSTTEIKQEEMRYVRLSLIWSAFSDPFDFDTDIHPSCLAEAVAREPWSQEYFERLSKSHQTHYEQWGEMFGVVQVEGHDEKMLSLRGYRDHSYGVRDWYSFHRYAINFAYLEDGTAFHVDSISMPDTLSLLQCGYLSRPNGIMTTVSWMDIDMIALGENQNPPKEYEFNFIADSKKYHVKVKTLETIIYYLQDDRRSILFEQISSYEVNGVRGYGVFEFVYRHQRVTPMNIPQTLPLLRGPQIVNNDESNKLSLSFMEPACGLAQLVGGKGCQLALLTQLKSPDFGVPKGFCLTISAFKRQLINHPDLAAMVSRLHEMSSSGATDLKNCCEKTVEAFRHAAVCIEVADSIREQLEHVFGSHYELLPVAVRSSATGEDGVELSAAGQMQTFLGVKGFQKVRRLLEYLFFRLRDPAHPLHAEFLTLADFDAICEAVRFCWASHFDFPAIAYRRQNGQPIISSAGVVIQDMAPSKAAGVLFTRDPLTGNPGVMMINANFGLGESVVSGEADPDQVTICRSWDDKLTIVRKEIGSKKMLVKLLESGGTENTVGDEVSAEACCLNDDVILRLADIGIELEKRFGDPRDIEFAVDNENKIYVLQARPITTLDHDSEWVLLHEFDSGYAADNELSITANIHNLTDGELVNKMYEIRVEMMPGAMTPLTISFFIESIEYAGQLNMIDSGIHECYHKGEKFTPLCCNKAFINLTWVLGSYEGNSAMGDKRMCELALLGEVLNDYSVDEVKAYNGDSSFWKRIHVMLLTLKRLYRGGRDESFWVEKSKTLTIADHKHASAKELYDEISLELPVMKRAWDFHLRRSASSAVWSNVLMSILTKRATVWTSEHFSDVALLLSKCEDVYSADVPTALKGLADRLAASSDKENFVKLSPEAAVEWLKAKESGRAGIEFAEFMDRHGHRCIREAELREKSWRTEPAKVVKVIQAMMQTTYKAKSSEEQCARSSPIDRLQSSTTAVGRFMLKRILPKAQKSVGERELAKSVTVKIADAFKLAYRKLAKMMVQESRLPDEDLIFFLTHREIGELLQTRSAKLLTRAQKRRQILPKQMSMEFSRVVHGHPKPIEKEMSAQSFTVLSKLSGMPVSQGVVTGKARVVKCLEDACSIQSGEILIVPYTDVGWSPYFPMIAGLATEIGGLLSHGAVVAREYGLPCVVNLANATNHFCSGDTVRLNGTRGTLEKVDQ